MFRPHWGFCKVCQSEAFIVVKEGLCKKHNEEKKGKPTYNVKIKVKSPIKRSQKPIPKRSKKREKEDRIYSKQRKKFLEDRPLCELRIENVCTNIATDVHHTNSRIGEHYLNESEWKSSCRGCHDHVHFKMSFEEAEERGFMKRRTI